jgi:hypothetical protein
MGNTVEAPATQSVDWQATLWRGFRGFVSTLLAIIVGSVATSFTGLATVPINFSDPKKTGGALAVAFFVGFFLSFGKAIRDKWGNPDGSGKVNKLVF